jgi:MSHA pilin protein MshC
VELVVVVVILGILALVAVPRFFDDRTFLERGYFEELTAALKYARRVAVASGCPVRMQITAGGYQARGQGGSRGGCNAADSSSTTDARLAGGELFSGDSPMGVSASPSVTLIFDALGRTDLPADQRISVGPFELTVRAQSGDVVAR